MGVKLFSKKIDKSLVQNGQLTVPESCIEHILSVINVESMYRGQSENIRILFRGETRDAVLSFVNNKSENYRREVHQILFNTKTPLRRKLGELYPDIDKTTSGDILEIWSTEQDKTLEFREQDIAIDRKDEEEKEKKMIDIKDALGKVKAYIFARGFDYPEGLIENFYLCLRSKPFVILAGISGTGKSKLVELFADAIGAGYKLVPVRPDWSDGNDLFGHNDLNGNFIPGPVCDIFEDAMENPDKPFFLCLDEMNLARVEYYLSDFLSVIESRKWTERKIQTDSIAQFKEGIPDNLYIIGTVNMDETTFPFSKKVLDRANTIEFSDVDLIPSFRTEEASDPLNLPNNFLRAKYLVLATDCTNDTESVQKICTELENLNNVLVKSNAQVGYRVRDEIVFYIQNNKDAGELLTYQQSMDNEIMQKVLPRIQGSASSVKTLLIDVFKFCMGDESGVDADAGDVGERMKSVASSAKYPKSAEKIGYMMARFEDDGFTSYWL